MSTEIPSSSKETDHPRRYREKAALARREASRAAGEVRESFLFLADQWDRLAQIAQSSESPSDTAG